MLNDVIQNSLLDDGEKEELVHAFKVCDEALKNEILEIAKIHPEIIPELYINFAAKKYAISKNDTKAFTSVVRGSKNILG